MNFAVAVLTFNHPHITLECLKTVTQIVPPEVIFVIHNGSLIPHREKIESTFPELHHIHMPQNKGFSGGCNVAMETVFEKFDWLYFLTNDTLLLELGAPPESPGLYAPLIWRRKKDVVDSLGGAFIPTEKKLYHLKNKDDIHLLPEGHYPYIPGTAFLMHRSIFQKVGLMDETLHTYWEDVDYSQRARLKKLQLGVHVNFELIHKVGKTCHKDPFYTNHLFRRNQDLISQKYRDA